MPDRLSCYEPQIVVETCSYARQRFTIDILHDRVEPPAIRQAIHMVYGCDALVLEMCNLPHLGKYLICTVIIRMSAISSGWPHLDGDWTIEPQVFSMKYERVCAFSEGAVQPNLFDRDNRAVNDSLPVLYDRERISLYVAHCTVRRW